MNTEINKFERIQEYLLGRMSKEDSVAFERDLTVDESLRKQYDDLMLFARSVKSANQEADLRMSLDEIEGQFAEISEPLCDETKLAAEISQVERELLMMGEALVESPNSSLRGSSNRVGQFFYALVSWFIPRGSLHSYLTGGNSTLSSLPYAVRIAVSFAVAVILAFVIILPYRAVKATSGFDYAPSHLELQTYRGNTSCALEKAIEAYNSGDYDVALSFLEKAKNELDIALKQLGDSDTDVVIKLNLTDELYYLEWNRVLALMKNRKVFAAKRALHKVSESASPFAGEASQVLEKVY